MLTVLSTSTLMSLARHMTGRLRRTKLLAQQRLDGMNMIWKIRASNRIQGSQCCPDAWMKGKVIFQHGHLSGEPS